MELRIKPSKNNTFPIDGFLIKGESVRGWLFEIQQLSFRLNQLKIYPIPGTEANSIWGCLVITGFKFEEKDIGRNEICQRVFPNLYIPEKSTLHPKLSVEDHQKLFSPDTHIFHPEFGLVELINDFNIIDLLKSPEEKFQFVFKPEEGIRIASGVKSFRIAAKPEEDILKALEEDFPKKEKDPNKPLSLLEKGKLGVLKKLFKEPKDSESAAEPTGLGKVIGGSVGILGKLFGAGKSWSNKIKENYEDLEQRNKKEVDRLMDMLKKNPGDALKYAIPLDENGSSRGGMGSGAFSLSQIWNNFSLFGSSGGIQRSGGGGGSVNIGDKFFELNRQYRESAEALIRQKDFKKAAFIYMKLLKDYQRAAETLEKGGFYQEAAVLYLKHGNQKLKAAVCYEKGKMYMEAIELYDELNDDEKVGDLYLLIGKKSKANEYYNRGVEKLITKGDYIKASGIYRDKIKSEVKAQETLLKGWNGFGNKQECLYLYLEYIKDQKVYRHEIDRIYSETHERIKKKILLDVIYRQYKSNDVQADHLRELAYPLIADLAVKKKNVLEKLRLFNTDDPEVQKDTSRHLSKKRKKHSRD